VNNPTKPNAVFQVDEHPASLDAWPDAVRKALETMGSVDAEIAQADAAGDFDGATRALERKVSAARTLASARTLGSGDDAPEFFRVANVCRSLMREHADAERAALIASTTPGTVRMDAIRRCESEADVAMLGGLLRHFDPQALEAARSGGAEMSGSISSTSLPTPPAGSSAVRTSPSSPARPGRGRWSTGSLTTMATIVRAAADKMRDSLMLCAGWMPVRFAAIDAIQNPEACADRVAAIVRRWALRVGA